MDFRYKPAVENRVRRPVDLPGMPPFSAWAARPEDVILGKLMAWEEGRSERHPADIYEMMVFYYLGDDDDLSFDTNYVDTRVLEISQEAADLWALINRSAKEVAEQT